MKLLSIKAHGFKSFADKIEILIGDGITGIVGPNGSGKSNVVDAVKWVLGETSLKEIRGGETASDVIFAGSASRPKLTRAWVSLTFDNSDHYLASDFKELEIKRVVYQTGENEYYINNTKVRKKDITDLFIDSGANADSFSIISQGKISEVLKGKPSDRRSIIEEAGGVLKYKKRKEETMRKLDSTKDNLEKISLVIAELETNVEPLRRQSEIAQKYVSYKDELKDIEIALLANDIKKINDEYITNKETLTKLTEEVANLDTTSNVDNSKIAKLKNDNLKLDEKITKTNEELLKITEDVSNLETKKKVISERQKYQAENQKLAANLITLKDDEINLKKDLASQKNNIKVLEETLDKYNDNLKSALEDYRVNGQKRSTILEELAKKNRLETSLRNQIDIINDNLDNDTKLPYAVKSVLNNPRLKGIHDVLCKIIDTKEEYAKALEIALGTSANVIIVDDENAGKSAINYLKDNQLGRATFFPISVIKARGVEDEVLKICHETPGFIDVASSLVTYNPLYRNIILNQLGNTLVVDNMNTMNILGKKIGYRYRIVTLDGELLHPGGSMTGGVNKISNGLINARFELEKLNKELAVTVNEAKLLEEHINQLDEENKILEERIFTLRGNIADNSETLNRLKSELETLNKRLSDTLSEISGIENIQQNKTSNELDEVMQKYLQAITKRDQIISNLNQLKTDKNDLLSEISEMELQSRKLTSEYNKKQTTIKELEIAIGKMDIRLDMALNRLSEEYSITYEKAINDYVLDLDENTARNKVSYLKREMKDLGEVNLGSIQEYERVNTRYTFLTNQKSDLEMAITNLMEVITDLDATMEKRFKETFIAVNNEFGQVFKKLFKGGHATLKMTEPDDILNTGIDIEALPPGKSLKNINALSGGEMTLTAIALLFSILNIRTVPFCILDEVEAALDEANVDTFGQYIKEYEKNSQFIIITHKKRTMEYVNNLYGITMQESGVSKLVSVRLESISDN